jgi:PleD family two-component response regulator
MYTERLESSFTNNSLNEFIEALASVQGMLQAVCAKRHEAYTVTLTRSARAGNTEFSGKVLQQAIADFLLLSIEMQKAQNLPETSAAFTYTETEKSEEMAQNLAAVIRLIDAQDYDRAKSIVADMSGMDFAIGRLGLALNAGDYTRAREAAVSMEKEYISKVNQVSTETSAKSGNKIVLSVDDRPEILTSVNTALRGYFKTFGASSGSIALEIMNQQDIGLFILDIEMPEMDGFELASRIRNNKQYKETPIIFLTGNSSRDRILKAIKLGISDFIVKPAYNEALLTKVRKYLE